MPHLDTLLIVAALSEEVTTEFSRLVSESLTVLRVEATHFRTASRLVDQHALGLRADDALHLAIASEKGATIHTFDHRLHAAGPTLGILTELVARGRTGPAMTNSLYPRASCAGRSRVAACMRTCAPSPFTRSRRGHRYTC